MTSIGPLRRVKERVADRAAPGDALVEALYRTDGARLERALVGSFGDRDLAQDATAEAFAQLLRRGTEVEHPAAWVWKAAFAIARGLADDRVRRIDRPLADPPFYPFERDLDVVRALKGLSPMQRQAVVLHHYAGFDLRTVAHITGSTVGALKVHLFRARTRLRADLGDDHDH